MATQWIAQATTSEDKMKRLVLLVIIMVLGISRAAIAGEDLDNLVNAEEGSTYFDLTYGAKLIGAAQQDPERGKHNPEYTKEELEKTRQMIMNEASANSDTNIALAALGSSVGQAQLGSIIDTRGADAAVAAINFPFPPGPQAYMVSQNDYTSAVRTASTQSFPNYNPAYGMGHYLNIWNYNFDSYINPSLRPVTIMGVYLGSVVQPADITSWTTINLDTGVYQPAQSEIDTYYDEYRQIVEMSQPDAEAMRRYYEWKNTTEAGTRQSYIENHPTDSASNY